MTLARTNTAIRRSQVRQAAYIPHLRIEEVRDLAAVASQEGYNGERDALLIQFIFDSCCRISEALGVKPFHFRKGVSGWSVSVFGKGSRPGEVAVSTSLVASVQSYVYRSRMDDMERIWPFNRHTAYKKVQRAFKLSGIEKPRGVGAIHVLRHSGAIARLAETGNPKAVQDQLRHMDASMTLRYLKTLQAQESLAIQQEVDFGW